MINDVVAFVAGSNRRSDLCRNSRQSQCRSMLVLNLQEVSCRSLMDWLNRSSTCTIGVVWIFYMGKMCTRINRVIVSV